MEKNSDLENIQMPEIKVPHHCRGRCNGGSNYSDSIVEIIESLAGLESKFDYLLLQMISKLWRVDEDLESIQKITASYAHIIQVLCDFQDATARTLDGACHCEQIKED